MTGVVLASWDFNEDQSWKTFRADLAFCVEFSPVVQGREQLGWVLAIPELLRIPEYAAAKRRGLVVDKGRDHHRAYNDREQPIFGDKYLPPGTTLVYASSDTGSEFLANAMLRLADRAAAEVHRKMEGGTLRPASPSIIGRPYSSLRFIRPNRRSDSSQASSCREWQPPEEFPGMPRAIQDVRAVIERDSQPRSAVSVEWQVWECSVETGYLETHGWGYEGRAVAGTCSAIHGTWPTGAATRPIVGGMVPGPVADIGATFTGHEAHVAVPEPSSTAMLLAGVLVVGAAASYEARRRRS